MLELSLSLVLALTGADVSGESDLSDDSASEGKTLIYLFAVTAYLITHQAFS